MTNAEARFNKSLRPRKPEGSLGRTAQDVHLDSHTAPELCVQFNEYRQHATFPIISSFDGVQEKVSATDGRQNHLTMI